MLSKVSLSFLSILSFQICCIMSTEHNSIKGRRFICGVDAPHLVNVSCRFKKVNRTTEFWSMNITYKVPVDDIHINLTNYHKQQNLQYKPFVLMNFHIDVCKFVDGSLGNKVLDIIFDDLNKYGNVFVRCPQHGTLYVKDLIFNDKNYPPIVPSGDSYLDFQYYTYVDGKVQKLYYLRPYLEVKTKGIFYW